MIDITSFTQKLDKIEGKTYVIEEEITIPAGGIYEAPLSHDHVNESSLTVYTGSGLTGEAVNTYVLSTPGNMPWKRIIRIQTGYAKVYVSYETDGDTVEAEDVNRLQDTLTQTQTALNREEQTARETEKLLLAFQEQAAQLIDEHGLHLDRVDEELEKRYTKEAVFSREEVLLKLEDIIDLAPDDLNTLGKLAAAIEADPAFAQTVRNALLRKVDAEDGMQLSANDYSDKEKGMVAELNEKKHIHANKPVLDELTKPILDKVAGIEDGAQKNVQPDWTATDQNAAAFIKNKPAAFVPSAHVHAKDQITDMPDKLSQFDNDTGFLTQLDLDGALYHTHSNKPLLDTLTQALINRWNSSLTTLPAHRHVKAEVTDFPENMPADGGNADTVNRHTVNADVPAGAKFTDTLYTHPASGAAAGTYRSVTVNAQGHVTAGTNPTTLAGYGITDAAGLNHNHDTVYLKKSSLTWADMKGG